jgi:hypothetical protein
MTDTLERYIQAELLQDPAVTAAVEHIDSVRRDTQLFQQEHSSSPIGRGLANFELNQVQGAIDYIKIPDPDTRAMIAGNNSLALEVSNALFHAPENEEELLNVLLETKDVLREVKESFPKDPIPQAEAVAKYEKLEAEAKDSWKNINQEQQKDIEAAAAMASSALKRIGMFIGVESKPTLEESKRAIDWSIEQSTGLAVSKLLLTPKQTLDYFDAVRKETLLEKTDRVLGLDRSLAIFKDLDSDLFDKVKLVFATTVLTAGLLAGPLSANISQAPNSSPATHTIVKTVEVNSGDIKQAIPAIEKQFGTTVQAIEKANPEILNSDSIDSTAATHAPKSAHTSEVEINVPVVVPVEIPANASPAVAATVFEWDQQNQTVDPLKNAAIETAPSSTSTTETTTSTTETTVPHKPDSETTTTLAPESVSQAAQNLIPSPEVMAQTPNTAEKYVIRVLQVLAKRMGVAETDTVTQSHINGLLAWGWLEEGDLGNTGYFNVFNTGIDDPNLLATQNNASGIQAFRSFEDGVLGTVETMMTPNQNRIAKLLCDPSVTAEQFFKGMTYWQDYPGNTYWAQADSDVTLDGITYTQGQYLQDLNSRYQQVMSDYARHATILLGYGMAIEKGLYAPLSAAKPNPVVEVASTTTIARAAKSTRHSSKAAGLALRSLSLRGFETHSEHKKIHNN